jgi:hypothetical protein
MTGAEFFADIIVSGTVFGLRVGDSVDRFDADLRLGFIDELHGRRGSRLLRRDYGLFEATFSDEASWRCTGIIVEVNRLAATDEIAAEIQEVAQVELPRYTSWADTRAVLDVSESASPLREVGRDGDYELYSLPQSGTTAHVIADPNSSRSESPGFGDLWSITLEPTA